MKEMLPYQIALTMVKDIGAVHAKNLIDYFGDAKSVLLAQKNELAQVDGIGEIRAKNILSFTDYAAVASEIEFIEKHNIQPIFIGAIAYPVRLLHCYDSPALLYYKGVAELNAQRVISIVGSRKHTEYGKRITEQLIAQLPNKNTLIVSGLALGIDAIAHKSALENSLPTIGVLAHGLDTIYPAQHRNLAKEILRTGGLLTEFRKNTITDKYNFPKRNRIVAGMADATIVIETAVKGGSMITANLAADYHREVFALPGKITDTKSAGCLHLIQQNKAIVFSGIEHFIETMQWDEAPIKAEKEKDCSIEFTATENSIIKLLETHTTLSIDALVQQSTHSGSSISEALLNLEFQNIITALPGKAYELY